MPIPWWTRAAVALGLLLTTGCFEQTLEVHLEPDGRAGRVDLTLTVAERPSQMLLFGPPGRRQEALDRVLADVLVGWTGVTAWSDLEARALDDGRVRVRARGWFEDVGAVGVRRRGGASAPGFGLRLRRGDRGRLDVIVEGARDADELLRLGPAAYEAEAARSAELLRRMSPGPALAVSVRQADSVLGERTLDGAGLAALSVAQHEAAAALREQVRAGAVTLSAAAEGLRGRAALTVVVDATSSPRPDFAAALEAAVRAWRDHPLRARVEGSGDPGAPSAALRSSELEETYAHAVEAARAGDTDEAFGALEELLGAGGYVFSRIEAEPAFAAMSAERMGRLLEGHRAHARAELVVHERGPVIAPRSGEGRDAPTLVWLHGAGAEAADWLEGLKRLPLEGWRLVVPERHERAFGALTTDASSALVAELLLDGVSRELAYLGGHSMGAFTGLEVALERPALVRGVVAVEGGFPSGFTLEAQVAERCAAAGLRLALVRGDASGFALPIEEDLAPLAARGLAARLWWYAGGHSPRLTSLQEALVPALEFVAEAP